MSSDAVTQIDLRAWLPHVASGKVREIYSLGESELLFITTDRISAYDVIMDNGIPKRGVLLTQLSAHWFQLLRLRMPSLQTHLLSLSLPEVLQQKLPSNITAQLNGRIMRVRNLKILPIEAIVRGYISGSAWKEYSEKGTVHFMQVSGPGGHKLQESERFESPIYTPSTKAEYGQKDENIHPDQATKLIGAKYAQRIKDLSLEIYTIARDYALARGIIIADTKFEFGLDEATDEVVLVDEVLTPDSSRFWPLKSYEVGRAQESFDKQHLRDWLTANGLQGKKGVVIPEDVVKETFKKYQKASEILKMRI